MSFSVPKRAVGSKAKARLSPALRPPASSFGPRRPLGWETQRSRVGLPSRVPIWTHGGETWTQESGPPRPAATRSPGPSGGQFQWISQECGHPLPGTLTPATSPVLTGPTVEEGGPQSWETWGSCGRMCKSERPREESPSCRPRLDPWETGLGLARPGRTPEERPVTPLNGCGVSVPIQSHFLPAAGLGGASSARGQCQAARCPRHLGSKSWKQPTCSSASPGLHPGIRDCSSCHQPSRTRSL